MAQTFEWTGAATTSWSDGSSWIPGAPSSASTSALVFNNNTALTTINNLGAGFMINSLKLGEGVAGRTFQASVGSTLVFAGTSPFIDNSSTTGTGTSSMQMPVRLDADLTLRGVTSFDRQFVFSSSAPISGTGGVRLESGIYVNNATSSYQGETVITGGLWGTNVSGGFGSTSGVRVEGTGGIQLIGTNSPVINRPLTVGGLGAAALGGYSLASSGTGTRTWSGAITVSADTRFRAFSNGVLSLTNTLTLGGNNLDLFTTGGGSVFSSGVISGEGDLSVRSVSTDFGNVFLQGSSANTFSGAILVEHSRLAFDNNGQFGDAANVITLNRGTLSTNNVGGAFVTRVIPATRELTIAAGGGRFEARNNQIIEVQTEIKGSGPVGVSGFVNFAPGNTFDGTLTLENKAGLTISNDSALGPITNLVRMEGGINGAGITLDGVAAGLAVGRVIEVAEGFSGAISSAAAGTHTIGSTLTGSKIQFANGKFNVTANNSVNRMAAFVGSSILVGKDAALGAAGGTVELFGGTLEATGDFTFGSGRTLELVNGGATSVIDTGSHTMKFEGSIADDPLNQSGALRKAGSGSLVLNGNATNLGVFTIAEGSLGGSGTLRSVVIASGAKLSPGESAGLMTFESLTLNPNSMTLIELGGTARGTSYDAIDTNFFTAGGTLSIGLINGFAPESGSSFQVLAFNNLASTFDDILLPTLPGALTWNTSDLLVSGHLSVVPEPGTTLVFCVLLGFVVTLHHRVCR